MVPVARTPLAEPLSSEPLSSEPLASEPLASEPLAPAPRQERPWPSRCLLPALDSAPPVAAPVARADGAGSAEPALFASTGNPGWRVSERPVRWRPAPARDPLWWQFWAAVVVALVSFGSALAASLAGAEQVPSVLAVRFLGWSALLLPLAVLGVALRAREPGRRARPDAALLTLGLVLEAAALVRLHAVLGVLAGTG